MARMGVGLACAGMLFCVLGTLTPAQGQVPSTGYQATGAADADGYGAVRRIGVALYRGHALRYEVINGTAVHDGDIVLGTVEEVLAGNSRSLASKDATGFWPVRRDISAVEDEFLWPGGVVPYVIDPGFTAEASGTIQAALDEWNSRTVIALVERTTESEFVRFQPAEDGDCRANVGRRAGQETGIWLPDACSVASTIHEIGHAVGLNHEHQRVDRDEYVVVSDVFTYGLDAYSYTAFGPAGGPYDYASVMHYQGIQTIPPGMPAMGGRLSAGDIDGVARLYGMAPAVTTIATNPPGMEIRVDGERMATPATFDWSPGSRHVVEALSPQTVGGRRCVFGRWNDEASRRRTVTAGPDRTWFEANYIVQQRLVACAEPAEAGDVRVRPESGDGYHATGAPVEIEAVPEGRHAFLRWHASDRLSVSADRGSRGLHHGESSNPATGSISPWGSLRGEYSARFAAEPLFRIDSNVDGIGVLVNGETKRLPWAFPAGAYPDGVTVEAPAVIPEETRARDEVRYHFESWSDGGDRIHRVTVPVTGGSVSLNMTHEYRLRVGARHHEDETAISISPASEDGFYPAGTQAVLTALPPRGQRFAGWSGEASGPGTAMTVVMDAAKSIEGVFTHSELLLPDEEEDVVLDAASRFVLYSYDQGWHVLVPRDAAEMTVRFQASSAAGVDLYIQRGFAVSSESAGDGEAPRIHADFESTAPGANETITIRRGSDPPLTNDVYYVALGAQPTGRAIRGTLSVEIRRSGIVGAWPRAFTFGAPRGSDPGSQAMQLTHETASPVRYRIDSNQQWLSASPQEWVQTRPGTTEVAVMVNSAGLADGTHHGDLTVVQVADESARAEAKTTGIEIPVALAVVPTNLSSSVSRRVNGVQIVSRPAEGDTYGAGEEIEVQVGLVEPAEVTGSPTLALRVGSQVRQVEWASQGVTGSCGEGYTTLVFRYIVQADDRDVDGIDIPGNALTLNGGSIAGSDGTPAVLATAPLVNAGDHRVDGSKVTPPAVSALWIASRPQAGDTYGAGEEIEVELGFSQPVEAGGAPTLALEVGGQTRHASLSHSYSTSVLFRYAVQSGDTDADGISIGVDALSLNGGSIRSAVGTDAELGLGGHVIVNAADHRVDGSKVTPPAVSALWITSRPQAGDTYGAGEEIEVQLGFSQPVEAGGAPTLALEVGGQTRHASLSHSYSTSVSFRYAVQSGDTDADGVSIGVDALSLNGGSIRSAGGTDAELGLGGHALVNATEHKVDGSKVTPPAVSALWIASRPQAGDTYGAGEEIEVELGFSQPVEAGGAPTLALEVGGQTRHASLSHSYSTSVLFRYAVQSGDTDADGISIGVDALSLNGGSIRSAVGTDAELGLGGHVIVNAADHRVDGSKVTPTAVSALWIVSRPHDGEAYGAGEEIEVQLGFSQPVEAGGAPTLALDVGGQTRHASLSSWGRESLRFRYAVQSGDTDADGISIGVDALSLNGGSIRSAGGTDAELGLGGHALVNATEHKVDGSKVAPTAVSGLWITSRPQDGEAYGAGEEIEVQLGFSQPVEAGGAPTLALDVGGQTRHASLSSWGRESLWFRYAVQSGDTDADGISIAADALILNGGSIRSAGGTAAVLDLGAHAIVNAAEHKVDGGG